MWHFLNSITQSYLRNLYAVLFPVDLRLGASRNLTLEDVIGIFQQGQFYRWLDLEH